MAKFATAVGPQATKWPHNMASEQNKKEIKKKAKLDEEEKRKREKTES